MKPLKAIIMAGGEGSRLRPLTCDCPKPMLPLLDRPLMEYAVRLLKRHGISEIAATLAYLPDAVTDYFGDGQSLGVQLRYYIEHEPLGTAGSVCRARDFLDERFIVLSGDGISNFDLSAALRFHREHGAAATLVLKKSAAPQEYGMVVAAPDGRIRSFHEKPGRNEIYSDLINTGVYILEPELLEHIPPDKPWDFGHDLFPALLAEGLPVYGCIADGYWCDVGDVAAYLRVHADALAGRLSPGMPAAGTEGALLEPGCCIEGPVYIAPGAHIAAGARIGPGCVIGSGAFVAPGAGLKRSIVLPGARIEPGAQLRGCVVGRSAVIGREARLFEHSVAGSGARVGERACLPPGVMLWPGKAVAGGEQPEENIVWGARREQRFCGGALQLETPAQAARAVQACAAELKLRELILGRGESSVDAAMWHAAAAGAMAQGAQVIDAGTCTLPQLRHACAMLHGQAAMLVDRNGLTPLLGRGEYLTERSRRGILRRMERQDFPAPFTAVTLPMYSAAPADAAYIAHAAAAFRSDPACAPDVVLSAPPMLMDLARRAFERAGLRLRCEEICENLHPEGNEIGVLLDSGGETALLSDGSGPLDEVQRQLACAWTALELGETRLLLPCDGTRACGELAAARDAHALYYPGEQAAWMHACAGKAPLQFSLQFDGLFFVLSFLSRLTERGLTLGRWKRSMPAACRQLRRMPVPAGEQGRLLNALASGSEEAQPGGGLRLTGRGGWAWFSPDDSGRELNIFAEAPDMETARELCSFYGSEIERLLREKQD